MERVKGDRVEGKGRQGGGERKPEEAYQEAGAALLGNSELGLTI